MRFRRHLTCTRRSLLLAVALVAAGCGTGTQEAAEPAPGSLGASAITSGSPTTVTTSPNASSDSTPTPPTSTGSISTLPTSTGSTSPTSTVTPAPSSSVATPGPTETTSVPFDGALAGSPGDADQIVGLRVESRVGDIATDDLREAVFSILNDDRGWIRAGFSFVSDDASPFTVILAEGDVVDALCLPLVTYGTVSCQNGPVVALNATRWREGVDHWDAEVADYRGYLVNHEVGHLLGQRHPKPRCVIAGRPAGVMEQQTAGLEGCRGNAWPRDWEVDLATQRPVVYAPLPDWGPDPVPANGER